MERSRPAPRSIARPLVLIVLGLLVILTYILWPVLAAISLGGFIVLVAQRPFEWLVRRLGGRRRLATWLGTGAVLLAVMVPIVGIGYLAVEEAAAGVQWVASEIDSLGGLQGVARHAPKFLRPSILHFAARGSSALGQVATRLA